MVLARKQWFFGLPLFTTLILCAACRDTDPPPSHYRDLGDGAGTILLPAASVRLDANLKDGKATWRPFREPGSEDPDQDATASRGSGDDAGNADSADSTGNIGKTDKIEAEIRELLVEFNEIAADGTTADLLEFFVEDQQDAVSQWLEAEVVIATKLGELRAALAEKLPDQADRIASAFAPIEAITGRDLVMETLEVVSETEVVGQRPPGAPLPTCRFIIVDDEWYMEFPGLTDFASVKPILDASLSGFDALVKALADGILPAEQVLTQLDAITKAAAEELQKHAEEELDKSAEDDG